MELYFVISILDRDKREQQAEIYRRLGLKVSLTLLGRGTARKEHLLSLGLSTKGKAVMATVADRAQARQLFRLSKEKMYIDIPGNGVMISVPIKSVGGAQTLANLTDGKPDDGKAPDLRFSHELIYVILNEGHSDEVMDAARPAGAAGGTVLAAKGTGLRQTQKFRGLTIAEEKEVVLIVARADNKAAIMRAIMEQAGAHTRAGAICFSLPVSQVAGLRLLEEEAGEN